ncbi:hypothetical protein HQ447_15725 [bacterium]|nr:hypothetical protein [bacterium]
MRPRFRKIIFRQLQPPDLPPPHHPFVAAVSNRQAPPHLACEIPSTPSSF